MIGFSSEIARTSPRSDGGAKVHFPVLACRRESGESRLIPGPVASAIALPSGLLLARLMF
ncbi:MAG: hypothetical protein V5B40_20480 [Candidatus Accumulibacter meliphilus]|uniref:hypothetical protein n=1 Tax=Candidatus Accumulibacter meliphilus TaxID=2211374 RepID=UPI002FC3A6EA